MGSIVKALVISGAVLAGTWSVGASAQTLLNGNFSSFNNSSGTDYGVTTTRMQAAGPTTTWTLQSGAGGVGYPAIITATQANQAGGFNANGTNVVFANANNNTGGPTITNSAGGTGGNFLAWENPSNTCGCYIWQSVGGLSIGQTYVVTFQQAGVVWNGGAGVQTSDNWKVGWGTSAANSVQAANQQTSTAMINKASPNSGWGFTGWLQQQITVTATATSMVLSFMANHPTGAAQPPFALLDGVTVAAAVPEPVSATLFLAGLGGLAALRRRRR